jgi:hypothetical protein
MQRQSAAVLTHVRAVLIIMHCVVVWFSCPSFMIAAVSHSQSASLDGQERSMSLYRTKLHVIELLSIKHKPFASFDCLQKLYHSLHSAACTRLAQGLTSNHE